MSSRLVDLDGKQTAISIVRDISESRRLQEQFLRSQKMETLGRLAGGVAHDFNNLLTAISGHAGFAASSLPPSHEASGDLAAVLKAAERAASLTRQLLAFSRRQVIEPRVVDLNDIVSDLKKMLRRLIGEHIEMVTELDPGLEPVRADPGQIEQVLVNLAVNARDAMLEGGRLTIRTGGADGQCGSGVGGGETAPGAGYVRLGVSDTGVGMSEEVKAHLFEPFFSTKEAGRGRGLGLATVYGIVKQHGGDIHVHSEVGHRATMEVYLPRAGSGQRAGTRESAPGSPVPGSETLLLVEDDQMLRKVTARMLAGLGYHLLVAGSGEEALRLVDEHQGGLDLVVSDVVMPGLGGAELASRLSQTNPGIRILFISGYRDNNLGPRKVSTPGRGFLQKPFDVATLSGKIRELLDGRPPV